MNINKSLLVAYLEGVEDRRLNPASYDEDAGNFFIFEAFEKRQSDVRLFKSLYDVNLNLAERAKWGKIYRDAETSFILR